VTVLIPKYFSEAVRVEVVMVDSICSMTIAYYKVRGEVYMLRGA
jgi:hypothetical protein